jgi:hypothetical protein
MSEEKKRFIQEFVPLREHLNLYCHLTLATFYI